MAINRPFLDGTRYYRMCGNKRKYKSKDEAERGNKDHVYECPYCKKWHRTHTPRASESATFFRY